jgi:hypothetical protein
MLVVAVAALAAWYIERKERFTRLAEFHEKRSRALIFSGRGGYGAYIVVNPRFPDLTEPEMEWHRAVGKKYRQSASAPWMPVPPDPPLEPFKFAVEKAHADARAQAMLDRGN